MLSRIENNSDAIVSCFRFVINSIVYLVTTCRGKAFCSPFQFSIELGRWIRVETIILTRIVGSYTMDIPGSLGHKGTQTAVFN